VPEQFGFDQRLGQGRAIHHHQGLVPARAQAMQAFGDEFLAGAALADHQHRTIERRRAAGAFERFQKGRRLADDVDSAFHAELLADFPNNWQDIKCG
jgi:hypothetical protein